MSKDKNSTCCNQECNQGRDCPVRLGTHKPAEALHQVVEPTATLAEIPEAVLDAVAEALGGAYDCLRVWSAWGVGTMGPDDFALVAEDGERLADIARAAITADRAALEAVNMRELTAYRTTVQNLEAELAALKAAPAAVAVPADLMAQIRALPTVKAAEFDGEESDGTPKRWRDRPYVSLTQLERLLRSALAATPAAGAAQAVEPQFLQRLRLEQQDLDVRQQALTAFLNTPAFQMLRPDDANLLRKQENQQHALLQTLNQRIHSASEQHLRSKNNG